MIQGKVEILGENLVSAPPCRLHIPQRLTWIEFGPPRWETYEWYYWSNRNVTMAVIRGEL